MTTVSVKIIWAGWDPIEHGLRWWVGMDVYYLEVNPHISHLQCAGTEEVEWRLAIVSFYLLFYILHHFHKNWFANIIIETKGTAGLLECFFSNLFDFSCLVTWFLSRICGFEQNPPGGSLNISYATVEGSGCLFMHLGQLFIFAYRILTDLKWHRILV